MQTDENLKYPKLKARRDLLREQQRCINGPAAERSDVVPRGPNPVQKVEHGPVVGGGKCQRCIDVWKKTNR